jgi:predicted TIM-barrel fold metal-dependent hydrolase
MPIDLHTHAFPDSLAERAISTLSAQGDWEAVGDGTQRGLIAAMDEADIDLSAVCAIATKPGQVKGILKFCKSLDPDRLLAFGSLHPLDTHPEKWVAKLATAGCCGIKLHPFYQQFAFDDPAMVPIYHAAIEHGLPIAFHCGYDIGFDDDPIPDRASPARLARVLDALPELRVLCTHMGGWKFWDDARAFLAGRDVYWETSFCLAHMTDEQFLEHLHSHRTDRVCFGTDWPWQSPAQDRTHLESLGLEPELLNAILFKNAAQFLGLYEK